MSMKENMKNISRFKNCFLLWNLSKFDYKSFANSFICFSLVFSLVLTSFPALAATESDVETDYYDISVADLVSDVDVSDDNDYSINCENTTNPLQPYVLNKKTGEMEPVSLTSQSLFKVSNSLMAASASSDDLPVIPSYYYELSPLALVCNVYYTLDNNSYSHESNVIYCDANKINLSRGTLTQVAYSALPPSIFNGQSNIPSASIYTVFKGNKDFNNIAGLKVYGSTVIGGVANNQSGLLTLADSYASRLYNFSANSVSTYCNQTSVISCTPPSSSAVTNGLGDSIECHIYYTFNNTGASSSVSGGGGQSDF